jgi:cytochrome c oxidase cbb3-type subunit IV
MSISGFHALWTVVLFVVFIGIVVWVFVLRRPGDFDEAARMPLEEDREREEDGRRG